MRLLHATSLEQTDFPSNELPDYVILSHTWEEEEVEYKHLQAGTFKDRKGYPKIHGACERAANDGKPRPLFHAAKRSCANDKAGYEWIWIDSVCIDRSSSAELSEAINSMYAWYSQANICYVYLSDYVSKTPVCEPSLKKCRWFRRGWTLQELLAPLSVEFYDCEWKEIGTKLTLKEHIRKITGIAGNVLEGGDLFDCSVACRMSWASQRQTSREEDVAYCLLGIFGVNMPLLYGEGALKAFRRLQEEIMKIQEDQSIFLWYPHSSENKVGSDGTARLLALSPKEFCSKTRGTCHVCHSPFEYNELEVLDLWEYKRVVDPTAQQVEPVPFSVALESFLIPRNLGMQATVWLALESKRPEGHDLYTALLNVRYRGKVVGLSLFTKAMGNIMMKNSPKFRLLDPVEDDAFIKSALFQSIFMYQPPHLNPANIQRRADRLAAQVDVDTGTNNVKMEDSFDPTSEEPNGFIQVASPQEPVEAETPQVAGSYLFKLARTSYDPADRYLAIAFIMKPYEHQETSWCRSAMKLFDHHPGQTAKDMFHKAASEEYKTFEAADRLTAAEFGRGVDVAIRRGPGKMVALSDDDGNGPSRVPHFVLHVREWKWQEGGQSNGA
jgi:hypothetical protein